MDVYVLRYVLLCYSLQALILVESLWATKFLFYFSHIALELIQRGRKGRCFQLPE